MRTHQPNDKIWPESNSRLPPSPGVDISIDRNELDRRTDEARIRQSMGAFEVSASASGLGDRMGLGNEFDEHSARFGDESPRRHADLRTRVEIIDDDDDISLHIPLQSGRRVEPSKLAGQDMTDDLSSLSFSRTLSPHRPTPPPIICSTTHDSPISGFEGMARELRKEFERITSGAQRTPGNRPVVNSVTDKVSRGLGSLEDRYGAGRRIFGDIANTVATSSTHDRNSTFAPADKTWTLPPAPAPSYADQPSNSSRKTPNRSHLLDGNATKLQQTYNRPEREPAPIVPSVAPGSRPRSMVTDGHYRLPDITGLTEGLASPEKAGGHRRIASSLLGSSATKDKEGEPRGNYPIGFGT